MSKKPSRKSWTYKQLIQMIDPATETLAVSEDKEVKFACIVDEETKRMKALFVKKDKNRYVRMDLEKMVKFIVDKLSPHFDPKAYLKELLLLQTPPADVAELFQRLEAPGVSIKQHEDCYTLRVGGKRGRPFDLVTVV